MRIGVLNTQVPFVKGGAERHAQSLVAALQERGYEATEITIPLKWYPGEVLARHILASKMLDLSEFNDVPIDLMIGLKFPAYLAQHPNKIFWILHQHRQAYDQWTSGASHLLDDPDGESVRNLITFEDKAAFTQATKPIFTNSENVTNRLRRYLGLSSTPLYHPPPQAEQFYCEKFDNYIFAPGRINRSKRLDLIIDSLAETQNSVQLVVAGQADTPQYQEHLKKQASARGVDHLIRWLGPVPRKILLDYYANARAIIFVPEDEDYGYITLEAMLSQKPVITTLDAGGPLEFITDSVNGFITPPNPRDLGTAMLTLAHDAKMSERMGRTGLKTYKKLNISWDNVVTSLVKYV